MNMNMNTVHPCPCLDIKSTWRVLNAHAYGHNSAASGRESSVDFCTLNLRKTQKGCPVPLPLFDQRVLPQPCAKIIMVECTHGVHLSSTLRGALESETVAEGKKNNAKKPPGWIWLKSFQSRSIVARMS
jgi:hypothetical protein